MGADSAVIGALPAVLIALCYYLSQSAWCAGVGFWTLYRPLVGGTLVGLILGDPVRGAEVGAAINLAYVGFVATGGMLPSDISLAGYLGTTLALVSDMDTPQVLALTVPVGMLGYLVYQLRMTLDGVFVHRADRCAARGDSRGVAFWNVWPPQLLLLALSGVPCFLGVYYGTSLLADALVRLPGWLFDGLSLAGALLPALGIAAILSLIWRRANPAWFVLGFVVAALAEVPVLPFAAGALALALIARGGPAQGPPPAAIDGEGTVPPSQDATSVRRRDRLVAWLTWLFFSHACYSYERMQGPGFCHGMIPVLRRLYPEGSDRMADALRRHMVYYNSEPNIGAITNGMTAALEAEHARENVPADAIVALKAGLMGPISGVGDTLIQGTLAPVLLSVGIGLAGTSPVAGAALYAIAICAVIWGSGYVLYEFGYRRGATLAHGLAEKGRVDEAVRLLEAVGAAVLGYLAATRVMIPLGLTVSLGGTTWGMRAVLEGLFPQVIPLAVVLLGVALLRRGLSQTRLVLLGLTLGALLGALLGHGG